jgi:chromosome partitioning protein
MKTKVITTLNGKGGSAKTTTVQNLAAALNHFNKRVLVIDFDGQANLTESMGYSVDEPQTIYGAMRGEHPLPIIETQSGVALVPSCLDFAASESELIGKRDRTLILKKLISQVIAERSLDYVIIDCPPSLGLLAVNALSASDYLIIPMQAQYLAMRGVSKIMTVVEMVRERVNPGLTIAGIVITQYNKRKTLNRIVAELLREQYGDKVFKTVIRDNVALAEAPTHGQNILEYSPRSNGAQDYLALAEEVLNLK